MKYIAKYANYRDSGRNNIPERPNGNQNNDDFTSLSSQGTQQNKKLVTARTWKPMFKSDDI